jgi:hypothetical protein
LFLDRVSHFCKVILRQRSSFVHLLTSWDFRRIPPYSVPGDLFWVILLNLLPFTSID